MKKTVDETASTQENKKALGKEIAALRKISLRKMADLAKLPPSNLKYIEDGVNAPSPEVYASLIKHLQPDPKQRKKMDGLYSSIRGAPPPDVCKIMIQIDGINGVIRLFESVELSAEHIGKMEALIKSFPSNT